ncbi:MAG TPA: DUF2099 family protein [Methanocella sp.]|nr:DUF2099 family protein [Methanocella sp.]
MVYQYAGVSTGCASKFIWGQGLKNQVYKVGDFIPIFGITPRGIRLIEELIKYIGKEIKLKLDAPQLDKLL